VIVHCAGGASVGFSVAHPHADFQRTVGCTADVLEYARLHARGARVVLCSSAGVYGEASPGPIPESAPRRPMSPYGMHKKMAEDLCRSYARSCGVASVAVRLFSVYGAGLRKQLLWDACNKSARGERRFFGTGAELRDWLHVDDAAALLAASVRLASGESPVINGGTGRAASTREILGSLFRELGVADQPAFTGESKAGDPVSLVADASRAFALPWRPAVDWEQGVAAVARWFRDGAP
jgi:UDP-glucose 4-epimerase